MAQQTENLCNTTNFDAGDTYIAYSSGAWHFVTSGWYHYTDARYLYTWDTATVCTKRLESMRFTFSDMRKNTHMYLVIYDSDGATVFSGDITSDTQFNLDWSESTDEAILYLFEFRIHNTSHANTYCDNNTPDITAIYGWYDDSIVINFVTHTHATDGNLIVPQIDTSKYTGSGYWSPLNGAYIAWATDHWHSVPDNLSEALATWDALLTSGTWSDAVHYPSMSFTFAVTGGEVGDVCYAVVRDSSGNTLFSGNITSGVAFSLNWSGSLGTDELYYAAVGVDSADGSYASNIAVDITKIFVQIPLISLTVSECYHTHHASTDLEMQEAYHAQATPELTIVYDATKQLVLTDNIHSHFVDIAPVGGQYVIVVDEVSHATAVDGPIVTRFPLAFFSEIKMYGCAVTTADNTYGGAVNYDSEIEYAFGYNKIFPDVANADRSAGLVTYRKVFFANTGTRGSWFNVLVSIPSNTLYTSDVVAMALGTASDTLADADDYTYVTSGSLTVGTLHPGQAFSVWLKRTVSAGAVQYRGNRFTLRISRS